MDAELKPMFKDFFEAMLNGQMDAHMKQGTLQMAEVTWVMAETTNGVVDVQEGSCPARQALQLAGVQSLSLMPVNGGHPCPEQPQ